MLKVIVVFVGCAGTVLAIGAINVFLGILIMPLACEVMRDLLIE